MKFFMFFLCLFFYGHTILAAEAVNSTSHTFLPKNEKTLNLALFNSTSNNKSKNFELPISFENQEDQTVIKLIQLENLNKNIGNERWFFVNSTSKPAFVGIQGGTAPATILRSPEGDLIAFTGKTGNDFVEVLHRDNSSKTVNQNSNTTESSTNLTLKDNSTLISKTYSQKEKNLNVSFFGKEYSLFSDYSNKYMLSQNILSKDFNFTSHIESISRRLKEELLSMPSEHIPGMPKSDLNVVFANTSKNTSLKTEKMAPFGLSPTDSPTILASSIMNNQKIQVTLKLRDYRKILFSTM